MTYTYMPVLKIIILLCILTIIIMAAGGLAIAFQRMKKEAAAAHENVTAQVSNRVEESLKLLESMAIQPEFYDPSVPPLEKVAKLDRDNGNLRLYHDLFCGFGY